jgi:hypothetical protein
MAKETHSVNEIKGEKDISQRRKRMRELRTRMRDRLDVEKAHRKYI